MQARAPHAVRDWRPAGFSRIAFRFSPSTTVNKTAVRDAILAELRAELDRQRAAAELARDEAISEESRPENRWDTHSQEAAYLAEGQARLTREVGEALGLISAMSLPDFRDGDRIALGALVQVDTGRGVTAYFLAPRAGGVEVTVAGRAVLVVTPQSPLGRQLIGRRAGEELTPPGTARSKPQRITTVA
jgi:transcription elongation GreA/GreB family factor